MKISNHKKKVPKILLKPSRAGEQEGEEEEGCLPPRESKSKTVNERERVRSPSSTHR